jgi:hypothetical protein
MAKVAELRQQPDRRDHHLLWPAQRRHLRWLVQLRLRQWRDPPHQRSVQLPRRSVQPWPLRRRRVSPHRRDRPHRALQGHDPRSIVPRRRSDRP